MGIMTKVQTEPELEHWDMVIEPHRYLRELKLGDLWRYKAPGMPKPPLDRTRFSCENSESEFSIPRHDKKPRI